MTAITTAQAATQAGVTVATIRTWCRYGAVQAAKHAGRWVISAASLARRITIGKERRMTNPLPTLDEAVAEYRRWDEQVTRYGEAVRRERREHAPGYIARVKEMKRLLGLCKGARFHWHDAVQAIQRGDTTDTEYNVGRARDFAQLAERGA